MSARVLIYRLQHRAIASQAGGNVPANDRPEVQARGAVGEHGRGFAVVAAEVRALAQRSADAAKEVQSLILDSVRGAETGNAAADHASGLIGDAVNAVERVREMIAQIASASQEQSEGVRQVTHALREMDTVTQRNASLVEEANEVSKALSAEAELLGDAIARFDLGTGPAQGFPEDTASGTAWAFEKGAMVAPPRPAEILAAPKESITLRK